ncbi:MAG: putative Zn-dependent peptidase [Planctomycetota bacterium]|nr:putative Zn-dependent peptidase [Planctomycetota bacterium]
MARRLTAPPLPAWVGDLPVFERTLSNGLKALVLPRPLAPVVVCDLYHPVGSVNEPPGKSGLAHFVEHMLFKGTDRFPKGHIDRLAFLAAGQTNAETGEDSTHYWFAFPADRWELALAVEADRMRGLRFDPREVEAERSVIAEERAREMDSPLGRLDQTHLAISYLVHPYRNPILGWPDDLRNTTSEDLSSFYETHYQPDGAVLVIVGAVDPDRTLDRVEAQFGVIPRGPTPRPAAPPSEPKQVGRREFALNEPDSVARGLLGWHSVPRGHADGPALDVLADLLTFGRRARLWERLVDGDRLATFVDAGHEPSRLAGQFLVQVEAAAGAEVAGIEDAVFDVISELAESGPNAEELRRSRHRLEAAWRWEQEDVFGLASGLGQVALWDDWRAWQAEHRAALTVSAEDVKRVAKTYLVDGGLTLGWSLPRGARSPIFPSPVAAVEGALAAGPDLATASSEVPPPHPLPLPLPREERGPDKLIRRGASTLSDYRPSREILPNGLRLISEVRPGTGTVALDLWVDSGPLREAKPGLAFLAGRLREEGTKSRSAEMLFAEVEDVGGTLDIGSTGVSLRVRAEDLALAVDLMADVTLRPAFPGEALGWTRRKTASELRADRDDHAFRAEERFRAMIYGDHPYGRDIRGSAGDLSRITLEDIHAHHDRLFAPDNSVLVAVGDFDPRRLRSLLKTAFGRWSPGGVVTAAPPVPKRADRRKVRRVASPGEQVHILVGHLGISRRDPDFDAMLVLDHILGTGPGFTDRLSRILRDELGLAYSVGGGMTDSADIIPGYLRIYVGTGPDEADRAVAAVLEQVEAMHRGEFSDEEVKLARDYLAGSWVFDYQTVGQRADRLLELERWGLPLEDPLHWPDRIASVKPRTVRAAARRQIDPKALARVEYGPVRTRKRGGDS